MDIRAPIILTMAGRRGAEHFFFFSWHFLTYDGKHDTGRCNYIPVNPGEVPDYYRRFIDRVDIATFKTCPLDENGYFNFGIANSWHRAVIDRASIVIVEVSEGGFTLGSAPAETRITVM